MPDSPSTPASPASPASPKSPASPSSPPHPHEDHDGPVIHAINELKGMVQGLLDKADESTPVQGEQPDATPQGIPWTHRGGRL